VGNRQEGKETIRKALRKVNFCGCGPYMRRRVGWRQQNGQSGAAIGLVENATFSTESVHASVGDVLVFYTDGVVEAVDPAGEQFGDERLMEFLLSNLGGRAGEIARGLRDAVNGFSKGRPLMDDTTILVCKRTE
jgi:phosphoserine phosphatase RsbU/P